MVKLATFVDTHPLGSDRLSQFWNNGHEQTYSSRMLIDVLEITSLIRLDPESCDAALIGANCGDQTNAQFGYAVTNHLIQVVPELPRIWIAHRPVEYYNSEETPSTNFKPEWFAATIRPDEIEHWLLVGGLEKAIEAGNPVT